MRADYPAGAKLRTPSAPVALLFTLFAVMGLTPLRAQTAGEAAKTMLSKYCVGCHNDRLKTAGLVLNPADVAKAGDDAEKWEKVLRQLRAGTMPPPGAPRPEAAVYARTSAYLGRELEVASAARPNAGVLPVAHRLSRTEYKNAVRDLLAMPALPKEYDFSTLLPADNVSSGFDNLADTLFMSPSATERYVEAARKIARIAVGDPTMEPLVNIHLTPVRTPQEQRNEELPFGTRGGVSIDGYFPLDGEYEFAVTTAGTVREAHTMEVTVDGVARASQAVSNATRPADYDPEVGDKWKFRFAVKAGARPVGVVFVEKSEALQEAAGAE